MLLSNKAVKFFFIINGSVEFKNLKRIEQLRNIIELYQNEKISDSEKVDILSSKGVKYDDNPSLVKYSKISKKFEELLKIEIKELKSSNEKKI